MWSRSQGEHHQMLQQRLQGELVPHRLNNKNGEMGLAISIPSVRFLLKEVNLNHHFFYGEDLGAATSDN